jgi:GDP-L-fucose synthase
LISKIVKFEGKINWDTSKPDGMQKKCLDVSVLNNLGFKHKIELEEGIQQTVSEYRNILKREL